MALAPVSGITSLTIIPGHLNAMARTRPVWTHMLAPRYRRFYDIARVVTIITHNA
jgi:hypothetical protein